MVVIVQSVEFNSRLINAAISASEALFAAVLIAELNVAAFEVNIAVRGGRFREPLANMLISVKSV
jgi:hypothetical protein